MPEPGRDDYSLSTLLRAATATLNGSSSPRLDAELLLANVLGLARADLYRTPERVLTAQERAAYCTHIEARRGGTPLAYLTGTAEFWSLPFTVTPAVLIPRPETEILVEQVLGLVPEDLHCTLADLGTGSGALAAALAHQRPRARVIATDASFEAVSVARRNFQALGLTHIEVLVGDWLRAFAADTFDFIVANPPYIAPEEAAALAPELGFEPATALFAAEHGTAALARIATTAAIALKPSGYVLLEHGAGQAEATRALLSDGGFVDITTTRDLAGHERVTRGRRMA